MINLKVKGLKELEEKFKNFHQENPRAISRAINKAHGVAQTASLKVARNEWNIKAGVYKKLSYVKKANVNKLNLEFGIISKPINLMHFGAKMTDKTKKVSYKIQKKSKKLDNKHFIAGKGEGYVFKRKSKDRHDIMPMFSISPSWMAHQASAEDEYIKVFLNGKSGGAGRGFEAIYKQQLKLLLEK